MVNSNVSTTPYNFIPLPGRAIMSQLGELIYAYKKGCLDQDAKFFENKKNQKLYKEHCRAIYADFINRKENLSGYIEVGIKPVTPICINWTKDSGKIFFSPKGYPVIPGSTLRGLIKNYLKILSCGTMRSGIHNDDFTDRRLYYRDVATTDDRNKFYRRKINGSDKIIVPDRDLLVGFLVKKSDNSYVIYPAGHPVTGFMYNGHFISQDDAKENPNYKGIKAEAEEYEKVHYNEIEVESEDSVIVHSGFMGGKKRCYLITVTDPEWDEGKEIPVNVNAIRDYKADDAIKASENQQDDRKLFYLLDDNKSNYHSIHEKFAQGHGFKHLVPCFYSTDKNGEVSQFGFARYYRISYEDPISTHISKLVNMDIIDFADAIFGSKECFASRVFFEDLEYADKGSGVRKLDTLSADLLSPKPTSYQFYLENDKGKALHWDEKIGNTYNPLRGYKIYWHQKNIHQYDVQSEKTATTLTLVKDGSFKGRIRFQNLTPVELGALLNVLSLGITGKFKIGGGKPLGLGTIDLKFSLHIFDYSKRYDSLFTNNQWTMGEQILTDNEYNIYTEQFVNYIKNSLKDHQNSIDKYDEIKKYLNIMLDWNNKPDSKAVAYMDVTDHRYREKTVLPTPEEVIKGIK